MSVTSAALAETVGQMLDQSAERFPDNEAIVVADSRLTFKDLRRKADLLAAGLLHLGLKPGDHVALLAPNLEEAYVALFGVAKMGGVFTPLNPKLQPRELEHALTRSGSAALLFTPSYGPTDYLTRLRHAAPGFGLTERLVNIPNLRVFVAIGSEVPSARSFESVLHLGARPEAAEQLRQVQNRISGSDPVLLQFTSGTTSFPKAALLAHAPTVRMGFCIGENYGLTGADRYFVCNPICHLGGTTFSLLAAISHGATFVTLPSFEPSTALLALSDERCTIQHGIDTHFMMEMSEPGFDSSKLHLRLCSVVGGPAVLATIHEAFRPDVTLSMYGSTETGGGPVCSHVSDPVEKLSSTVGRPLPSVELVIVAPDSDEEKPSGSAGEIRIGGWSLMMGYFGQPLETQQQLDSKGRARTGDIGYIDDQSYLHFMGRISNVIRVGGENISPEEVEAVLQTHPGIQLAGVASVPDDRLGEAVVAFVAFKPGFDVDETELRSFCFSQLASYKVPRKIRAVSVGAIPMTESGKVQRQTLQQMAAREFLGEGQASGVRTPSDT